MNTSPTFRQYRRTYISYVDFMNFLDIQIRLCYNIDNQEKGYQWTGMI